MSQARHDSLPSGRVALLLTDVQGSTALLHELGSAYGEVLDGHDRVLREIWGEFGGVEVDNEGDAFFVAFADHGAAIEAVTTAQRQLAKTAWPGGVEVKVRMGLHSGEPAIRGRKYWGVDVHYAARLASAAHGGQVLLSDMMRAQVPAAVVEDLGLHGLKDFPAARRLFHLVVDGSSPTDFPPPRTLAAARSNLPTIDTPIIGRDDVIADLRDRLSRSQHLVTLVGPGGIGKTRTALAVAEEMAPDFPDGTGFVAMASLIAASEVPEAIAEAIEENLQGIDATTALAAHLRDRSLLLVLDNAEHLTGLGEVLAPLVAASQGTRWLITSQEPVGLRGETQVRLGALEVPSPDDQDVISVAAAALFLERARARRPDFDIPEGELALLVTVCRELEGIPLALELAAARAPTLGLGKLVDALASDPDAALGHGAADLPARQRGLRAALDWTVSLLSDLEVNLYAACGAFAEAWSIDDMEFMVEGRAGATEVWDSLARLLDLALVVQRGDGRFTMPERVRRHAAQVHDARVDVWSSRQRHAQLVLQTVDRLTTHDRHVNFRSAVAQLEDHLPELVHALTWASANDADTHRMLLGTSGWTLSWFGRLGPWLDDVARYARAPDPGDLAQGRLWALAATEYSQLDQAERKRWSDDALTRLLELEDHAWVCEAYGLCAELLRTGGTPEDALAALDNGREYASRHKLPTYVQLSSDMIVAVDTWLGDYARAEDRIRAWFAAPGFDNWVRSFAWGYLGDCSFGLGRYREGMVCYARFIRSTSRSEVTNALYQALGIAACCAGLGLDGSAVEIASGCEQVAAVLQFDLGPALQFAATAENLQAAQARLRPDELAEARARGAQFDCDTLTERALSVADDFGLAVPFS